VDFDPSDYYRIPEYVVEDPVEFIESRLSKLATSFREEAALEYAINQAGVIEASSSDD